jgi:aarF domain-containing kinase
LLVSPDPHPGNIFLLDNGDVGLIDFGQVKQLSGRYQETLAKIIVALDENDRSPSSLTRIEKLAFELGIELKEDANEHAAAAVAMWLFDGSVEDLPGGFENSELSPNSPIKAVKSFPQDLVLVARSSMLIKALARRFGIPWSLAKEWAPIARGSLDLEPTKRVKPSINGVGKSVKKWGVRKLMPIVSKLRGRRSIR